MDGSVLNGNTIENYEDEDEDFFVAGDLDEDIETQNEGIFFPELETMDTNDLLFLAQLAEKTENFDDMRIFMRQMVILKPVLSDEERNLLSIAYKNVVGKHRSSWRKVWNLLQAELKSKEAEEEKKNKLDLSRNQVSLGETLGIHRSDMTSGSLNSLNGMAISGIDNTMTEPMFREEEQDKTPLTIISEKIRADLEEVCYEFINLLTEDLLPQVPNDGMETSVFYKKLVGDYYRYLSEYTSEGSRKDTISEANEYYKDALALSAEFLPPASSLRLGLCLNASVFYFEIMNTPDKACELAKTTYDEAVASLEGIEEESQKESFLLLDLLRENLTIWTLSE